MMNKVLKRSFWVIRKTHVNAYVRSTSRAGVIFTHEEILATIDENITLNNSKGFSVSSEGFSSSAGVSNSFNASLSKHGLNINDFRRYDEYRVRLTFELEQHIIGLPWNGNVFFPTYVLWKTRCGDYPKE